MLPSNEIKLQYDALTSDVGLHDLSGRTQIEITGQDRAKFLHGMSTNDIQALQPGHGCEAFLTDVQGKIANYVFVFCHEDALVLDAVTAQAETIIKGLDRYIIREDVELHDRSGERGDLLVCGASAGTQLREQIRQAVPLNPLEHCDVEFAGEAVTIRRVPFAGTESFFLSCGWQQREVCVAALQRAGATVCDASAVEIARIEAGTPLFGCDITTDNLPQEVNRNELAINFTKGCYLGQETIARIDALGHVNRTLNQVRFDSDEVPPAGTQCSVGKKIVARVTSSCWSFKLNAPLALAYIRRGYSRLGTKLPSGYGEGEVVSV